MKRLVSNKIRTPDGSILQSFHRHDYVTHIDANGEEYMVDGGLSYLRRNTYKIPFEDLSVYNTDPFELVREEFHWGTYGKNGDQPLTYKPLKDLTSSHIEAILETQHHIPAEFVELFEKELVYRNEDK